MQKDKSILFSGFIHLGVPIVVAILLVGFLFISAKENFNKPSLNSAVLSESDNSGSGSVKDSDEDKTEDNSGGDSDNSDKPNPTESGSSSDNDQEMKVEDENKVDEETENEIEDLEFENEASVDDNETEDLVNEDNEQKIEIRTENGKVRVTIKSKNSFGKEVEEEFDATSSANLASIKLMLKNGELKLKIKTENGKVKIEQELEGSVASALTDLPISLNSENNTIVVHMDEGDVALNEFPAGVVQELLENDDLDQVNKLTLQIKDQERERKVIYHAAGIDEVKLFGLIKIMSQKEFEVNATTGEMETVSEPWYLKYLSFLFTE